MFKLPLVDFFFKMTHAGCFLIVRSTAGKNLFSHPGNFLLPFSFSRQIKMLSSSKQNNHPCPKVVRGKYEEATQASSKVYVLSLRVR